MVGRMDDLPEKLETHFRRSAHSSKFRGVTPLEIHRDAGAALRAPDVVRRLRDAIPALTREHLGESGISPLRDARDAFAARLHLAEAADHTLDVQYYIWHNDMSGTLLFDALRRAADRGVRVRLLLDDNNTSGLDAILAELNAHLNIQVRLFNPFKHRRWRALGYLTDFSRLNRRMHNKSFTADGQVTIIGGRNVGDEYFGAAHDVLFVDLDALAVGPVVADVARDFDLYWSSQSSHPVERILPTPGMRTIGDVTFAASLVEREPRTVAYGEAIASSRCVADLLEGRLPLEWAKTVVVSDDPAKGLGRARKREHLWPRLERILKQPTRDVQLISPYFVPTREGVKSFRSLARQGVKIEVLTNSLEATDVAAVHAGYAKRRRALLEAGIKLFEIKRTASSPSPRDRRMTGSSASSLHAKTFSVDGSHVFVGSFNFDPRSARLNTEIGFVIDSPRLAHALADAFATRIPLNAYRVELDGRGGLRWVEQVDGREIVHRREPGATLWRSLTVFVLSRLPIEWLL